MQAHRIAFLAKQLWAVNRWKLIELRLDREADALQQAKARGTRLGAPISVSSGVEARIVNRRKQGRTLQQIADELTDEGIATPRKGRVWRHATIRSILSRHEVPKYPRGRWPQK